jgi:hypothetical protein
VTITSWDGAKVVHVGTMEIWDGADLALLRDTLIRLVDQEGCRSLGVDMSHVKFVPSGFFGMLYDWYEKGVRVRVFGPLSHVKRMLWFTECFHDVGNEWHELRHGVETEETDDPVTSDQLLEPAACLSTSPSAASD